MKDSENKYEDPERKHIYRHMRRERRELIKRAWRKREHAHEREITHTARKKQASSEKRNNHLRIPYPAWYRRDKNNDGEA